MNHLPQGGNSTSGSGGANANNSNLNQQQFQEMMYNSFLNHLNQNKPASGSGASASGSANAAATSGTAASGSAATLAQQQKFMNSQPQQRYYSNANASMINDPLAQQTYLQQQQQQQMFQQQQLHALQQQGGQGSGSGNGGSTNTNSNSANYSPQYMHDQLQYHPSGNGTMQYNSANGQFPYHPQSFQQGQQPQVAQYNQVNQDQMQQYQQQFNQQNQPNMQQAQLKAQQRTLQLNGDGTPQATTKSGKPRKSHKKNQGQAANNATTGHQNSAANQANHPKKLSSTQSRIEKRKQLKKQGPKRPSSAYFLFSMSIRNELLQQFPDAKVPELSKLASARWRELSDDEKKPYYDEFRTNWEKYRVLRDEYEKTLPPKRPSGPFIQFTQEVRPLVVKENPDKNLIEITKIIGSKWRDLDPVKKNEYTEMYKKRLKEWEECYPEEAAALEQATQAKKGRKKSAKQTEAPVHDNTAAITDPNLLNAGNISVGVADLSSMVPKMETMQ